MPFACFTYRLNTGVRAEDYERWIVDFDYPHVERMTHVIRSQRIFRAEAPVFGSQAPPYDYVEIIEFTDRAEYLDLLANDPNAQAIAREMPRFVSVVGNSFARFIPPGVSA